MENKDYQKRVAAIHDLSGFGKCSLTVALPILSAAGIEACAMPTAILSTHTGGISGYTYRDLTSDMRAFMQHWKSLDIQFDATYSGFIRTTGPRQRVFRTIQIKKQPDPGRSGNGGQRRTISHIPA